MSFSTRALDSAPSAAVYSNPNGMPFSNGQVLHMDLARGDINNRIITVGTASRAEKVAGYFDSITSRVAAGRGFLTINGLYLGNPVSVVSIGMGPSMMDFFVREVRAVTNGPIICARFGTCGGISDKALCGSVVVAKQGSSMVNRNPDAFAYNYSGDAATATASVPKYNIFQVAPADERLSDALITQLTQVLETDEELMQGHTAGQLVSQGVNITGESFYSSQGRIDPEFDDGNDELIAQVCAKFPTALTMEMETFQLFHLAKCSKQPFYASAAAIVVANRSDNTTVEGGRLERVEALGAKAVLHAVATLVVD